MHACMQAGGRYTWDMSYRLCFFIIYFLLLHPIPDTHTIIIRKKERKKVSLLLLISQSSSSSSSSSRNALTNDHDAEKKQEKRKRERESVSAAVDRSGKLNFIQSLGRGDVLHATCLSSLSISLCQFWLCWEIRSGTDHILNELCSKILNRSCTAHVPIPTTCVCFCACVYCMKSWNRPTSKVPR